MARTHRKWKRQTATRCGVSGKASFRSARAAREFVRLEDEWHGDRARTYRCPHCDWFHLTSQPTLWEQRRWAARAQGGRAA